jgi:hypothetical protein
VLDQIDVDRRSREESAGEDGEERAGGSQHRIDVIHGRKA